MAIGAKRLVVGAHYGMGDWLAQRLSALILGAYLLALFVVVLTRSDRSYDGWAGMFAPLWVKIASLLAIAALIYHAWIGMRDIWMDYIKPAGIRLTLLVLTALWLGFCAVWSVQILWRV